MKLRGKYLVTVAATDTGGLSSSTVLEVSDRNHAAEFFFMTPHETFACLCCRHIGIQVCVNTSVCIYRFSQLMRHIKWNLNLHYLKKKLKITVTKSSGTFLHTCTTVYSIQLTLKSACVSLQTSYFFSDLLISRALTAATRAAVEIVQIRSDTSAVYRQVSFHL